MKVSAILFAVVALTLNSVALGLAEKNLQTIVFYPKDCIGKSLVSQEDIMKCLIENPEAAYEKVNENIAIAADKLLKANENIAIATDKLSKATKKRVTVEINDLNIELKRLKVIKREMFRLIDNPDKYTPVFTFEVPTNVDEPNKSLSKDGDNESDKKATVPDTDADKGTTGNNNEPEAPKTPELPLAPLNLHQNDTLEQNNNGEEEIKTETNASSFLMPSIAFTIFAIGSSVYLL